MGKRNLRQSYQDLDSSLPIAGLIDHFNRLGYFLSVKGESPFKIKALNLAKSLLEDNLSNLNLKNSEVLLDQLAKFRGVGDSTLQIISQFLQRESSDVYDNLIEQFPETLWELKSVRGLGAGKIRTLYENLKITSLEELKSVLNHDSDNSKLMALPGFGKKVIANLRMNLEFQSRSASQILLPEAWLLIKDFEALLSELSFEITGAVRRGEYQIASIELICTDNSVALYSQLEKLQQQRIIFELFRTTEAEFSKLVPGFCQLPGFYPEAFEFKFMQLPFRLICSPENNLGWELFRTTGPLEYLTKYDSGLQQINQLILNGRTFKSENEIFDYLEIACLPPEMRAAVCRFDLNLTSEEISSIVDISDIKGLFHVHTDYSDGKVSLSEIILEAQRRGYEYIGISDHSVSAYYAGGLTAGQLKTQSLEIDGYSDLKDFKVFKGVESDIQITGNLDYSSNVLKALDFVIASIHSGFQTDEESMTQRIINAVENPYTSIMGHLTGRLLLNRPPYPLNIQRVLKRCLETGTVVEHNCYPERLDLDYSHIYKFTGGGGQLCLSVDSHDLAGLDNLKWGIIQLRRGLCPRDSVINSWPADKLNDFFQQQRQLKLKSSVQSFQKFKKLISRPESELLPILKNLYPVGHCELTAADGWQLLIATILSAQCTDKRVNLVTPVLFDKYPGPCELASAELNQVIEIIRSTGFFNNKARNIIECSAVICRVYRGELPSTIDELTALPGVGRKTANVVLGNWFGYPAIVVDTHVKRLSNRLGLTSNKDPDRIEQDLMKIIPESDWVWFSHALIYHGRRVCGARKPDCKHCDLSGICPQIFN